MAPPHDEDEEAQARVPIWGDKKTWYRAVDYLGPETEWRQPRIALLVRGDGPLMRDENNVVVTFSSLQDVAWWGRTHALYIIGLEPRG